MAPSLAGARFPTRTCGVPYPRPMPTDGFADRVHDATLGYFQILSMYLGLRLGLYDALGENELTSDALADRAGIDEGYAGEWCEQQSTIGVLTANTRAEPHTFGLPTDVKE